MRIVPFILVGSAMLAGCHASIDRTAADGNDQSVHIAMDGAGDGDNVSMTIPGFNARVALPSMNLGRHVDLDGIKLAPDTKVTTMDINARDSDGGRGEDDSGQVRMGFASPRPPAALIDYYRGQAGAAGYGAITAGADALTATKGNKRFALAVTPQGAGSKGTITMTGSGG